MNLRAITILPREDSVMRKGLKKLIKGPGHGDGVGVNAPARGPGVISSAEVDQLILHEI